MKLKTIHNPVSVKNQFQKKPRFFFNHSFYIISNSHVFRSENAQKLKQFGLQKISCHSTQNIPLDSPSAGNIYILNRTEQANENYRQFNILKSRLPECPIIICNDSKSLFRNLIITLSIHKNTFSV